MKSAYELAMERLGGKLRHYTPEQKEQLAEVDRLYASRIAQAKFDAAARQRDTADDAEKLKRIEADMASEIQSLEGKRERAKEELRASFDASAAKA